MKRMPRALGFVVVAVLSLLGSQTVSHAPSERAAARAVGLVERTAVVHVQGLDHVGRPASAVASRSVSDQLTSRRAHQALAGTGSIWLWALVGAAAIAAFELERGSVGGRRRLVSRGPPSTFAS